jgi:asparagine synthase (glutamine-hydrolysing)
MNLPADANKVERTSSAFPIKVRSPLLDHDLLDFAVSLPTSLKLRNGFTKYILRKVLLKHTKLPKKIVLSKYKRGFECPIEHWLQHDLKGFAQEKLLDKPNDLVAHADKYYIKKAMSRLDRYDAFKIWSLLMLSTWYDIYKLE